MQQISPKEQTGEERRTTGDFVAKCIWIIQVNEWWINQILFERMKHKILWNFVIQPNHSFHAREPDPLAINKWERMQ